MKDKIIQLLSNASALPVLFIGSGLQDGIWGFLIGRGY